MFICEHTLYTSTTTSTIIIIIIYEWGWVPVSAAVVAAQQHYWCCCRCYRVQDKQHVFLHYVYCFIHFETETCHWPTDKQCQWMEIMSKIKKENKGVLPSKQAGKQTGGWIGGRARAHNTLVLDWQRYFCNPGHHTAAVAKRPVATSTGTLRHNSLPPPPPVYLFMFTKFIVRGIIYFALNWKGDRTY